MNIQRTPAPSRRVNGRDYRFPKAPTVVRLHRRLRARLHRARDRGGPRAELRAADAQTAPTCSAQSRRSRASPTRTTCRSSPAAPPAVHGIAGNYFYDRATRRGSDDERRELPARADHPEGLPRRRRQGRGGHRQGQAARAARPRARHGERPRHRFSSEKADKATLEENGIDDVLELVGMPLPEVYSAELSEFVFAAGVKLLKRERPDVMYLSTTDYVQHKAAPGIRVANAFYAMMDRYVGAARRAGLRARAHRRPRHERQASARTASPT